MSSRKTLTIGTNIEGEVVILKVKDEGCGISPEIINRLETPFLTTKVNGTGLGLAVCYSIASHHGATLAFESSSAGTTCSVRFISGQE